MAKKKKAMSDSELSALVSRLSNSSATESSSSIAEDTAKAMEAYLGEKYGNEDPNNSQVVTREVTEAIEFAMPYLVKTFFGTDNPVQFQPQGPEDIESAEQATDYVNYVFNRQNPGFKVGYTWLKDALIQKFGVVKVFWDDDSEERTIKLRDLSEDEIDAYLAQDEVLEITKDVLEVDENENPVSRETTFKINKPGGQVRLINVPPEEFLVARGTKELQDSNYTAHKTSKRLSELRSMGFDLESIEAELGGDSSSELKTSPQYVVRHNADNDGEEVGDRSLDANDPEVTVLESFVRVDFDGDGVTELRKVVTIGTHVIQNDEVDKSPFYGWTPIILSHKLHGLSYADLIMDLQLIKTTIVRGMLDNMYLANHGRHKVIESQVNIDDMLSSRANGIVRVKSMNAVERLDHPDVSPMTFSLLGYLDDMAHNRTGMNERSRGTDGDLLNSNVPISNMNQIMSAADQRIELVARVFAETGFKELMIGIHDLSIKNEKKEKVVRLRGKFVTVNPSEWKERLDMTAEVGLGNNNRDQDMVHLNNIASLQERIVAGGGLGTIVKPKGIYNLATEFVKTSGRKDAENYFSDPGDASGIEEKGPSIDEQVKMAKAETERATLEVKKMEAEIEVEKLKLEAAELEFRKQQHQDENEFKLAELALEAKQQRGVKVGD